MRAALECISASLQLCQYLSIFSIISSPSVSLLFVFLSFSLLCLLLSLSLLISCPTLSFLFLVLFSVSICVSIWSSSSTLFQDLHMISSSSAHPFLSPPTSFPQHLSFSFSFSFLSPSCFFSRASVNCLVGLGPGRWIFAGGGHLSCALTLSVWPCGSNGHLACAPYVFPTWPARSW